MNQKLYNHLDKETNDNLFYNFKHDGLMNFEKKIISGKILYKRKFDRIRLKEEKSLIIKEIESRIQKYGDKSSLENRKRKQVSLSILGTILSAIVSLFFLVYPKIQNEGISSWELYSLAAFALSLIFFTIFRFNKKVQKRVSIDLNDLKLQQQRLKIIESEWEF
jgi:hypothetical protein